jgi:hypothetical protein
MRTPSSFQESVRVPLFLLCVAVSAAAIACSEAAGSGDTSVGLQISEDAVVVENLTGTALARGEVSIIPQGIPRPYTALLSRMGSGEKRTIALSSFRMDGTPFRRNVAKGRRVKIHVTDVAGKAHEREIPFK